MLVDTSGLLSLLDRRQASHADAVRIFRSRRLRLTHSLVIAEYVPLAQTRGVSRPDILDSLTAILTDRRLSIVWADEVLIRRAADLLQSRRDKQYSLCDALSFVLMRDRNITEALTLDHHFEQEGFQRLLTE